MKTLIAIPCIDRDADLQELLYNSISCPIEYRIIVITRKKDIKCQEFWHNKARLIIMPDYSITERHNLEQLAITFNILKACFISSDYDIMTIVESDIILNKDTLTKHQKYIKDHHVVLSSFDIPWAGHPVIVKGPFPYISKYIRGDGEVVLGSGTGVITIRRDTKANFCVGSFNGITGQDVGFFTQCYTRGHSVFMVNDHVRHLYKIDPGGGRTHNL